MFTRQIGNVIVHFEPLIIVVVAILIVYFVLALLLRYRGKKITESFQDGNYEVVLKEGIKLLKTYQRYAKRYKRKPRNIMAWIEYLNFALAVSNFSVKNYDQFLYHISALTQNQDIKEFWLSLYCLRQDDIDGFQSHYENIKVTEETLINRTYLESIKLYTQAEYDLAKTKMSEIYSDLKHPILMKIADKILKSSN